MSEKGKSTLLLKQVTNNLGNAIGKLPTFPDLGFKHYDGEVHPKVGSSPS